MNINSINPGSNSEEPNTLLSDTTPSKSIADFNVAFNASDMPVKNFSIGTLHSFRANGARIWGQYDNAPSKPIIYTADNSQKLEVSIGSGAVTTADLYVRGSGHVHVSVNGTIEVNGKSLAFQYYDGKGLDVKVTRSADGGFSVQIKTSEATYNISRQADAIGRNHLLVTGQASGNASLKLDKGLDGENYL